MWNTQNSSSPSDYWPNSLTDEEFRALVNRIGLIERWPEPIKWKESEGQLIDSKPTDQPAQNKV
jgi:hypothetical protein